MSCCSADGFRKFQKMDGGNSMKKSRIFALVLALALCLTTLVACGNGNQAPSADPNASVAPSDGTATEGTIKIGVITPLTGDVAVYGTAVNNGIKLYTEQLNKAGGINGKEVQLVIYDDKGDATESLNAYNKLVTSDQVVAIIGPVTSSPTFGVAQKSVADNMPCITASATHPDVTKYGSNFFRTCFEDPFQGGKMASYAKEKLGASTAAIIYNTSDAYSTGLMEAFTAKAQEAGLSIVATEGYAKGDVDFNAQLTNISGKNPDVLFIPDYYNTAYLICSQARQLGIKSTFLGVDGTDGVLTIEGADTSVFDGMYYPNHYYSGDTSEKVQSFQTAYKAAYNQDPNSFSALGYDSAQIMFSAIKTTEDGGQTIDTSAECRQTIIDSLKATDLDCLTGHITFDENNNPIKECTIIKIQGGKDEYVEKY